MNNIKGIINIPDLCFKHGLKHIVISPGSRNAPLVISFLKHQKIKCYSIPDERSAGYFALGLSLYLNKPVGVLCTSGTATLNLAPSVAEAFYQNLPLIVFTADRPPEWIDQEDGQTINQTDIYRNFIKKSFIYPVNILDNDDLWFANRIISEALELSMLFPAGPVHINIPLKEPLYDNSLKSEKTSIRKIIKIEIPKVFVDNNYVKQIAIELNNYRKIMIINGFGRENQELKNHLYNIYNNKQAVIVAENISNLKSEEFISTPDSFFALMELLPKEFYPDLLITTGNSVVSKNMKQFFRKLNIEHWRLHSNLLFSDTYQNLSKEIKISPEIFFKIFEDVYQPDNKSFNYFEKLIKLQLSINNFNNIIFNEIPHSDLKSIFYVLNNLPENSTIFLSNSTPIRYSQLIKSRKDLTYYSNRGTSGIDGCLSTAVGYSSISESQNFIIIGDIAFMYDSNALWNKFGNNLKIILMNNGGGNIFKLIQNYDDYESIKDFFETKIDVDYKFIAKAFNLDYFFCDNFDDLNKFFYDFVNSEKKAILEIKTSPEINSFVYKEYFKKLIQYGKN